MEALLASVENLKRVFEYIRFKGTTITIKLRNVDEFIYDLSKSKDDATTIDCRHGKFEVESPWYQTSTQCKIRLLITAPHIKIYYYFDTKYILRKVMVTAGEGLLVNDGGWRKNIRTENDKGKIVHETLRFDVDDSIFFDTFYDTP
jgi:hypothetical protein